MAKKFTPFGKMPMENDMPGTGKKPNPFAKGKKPNPFAAAKGKKGMNPFAGMKKGKK